MMMRMRMRNAVVEEEVEMFIDLRHIKKLLYKDE